ncbi:hypothetical protein MPSI1_001332 [Malassezia psittaci]|uniref:Thioesterase domain-containing protein n=1 Tax=Malassezia psittaci TaxID=1821823 RepID=A0AAF0F998_9BASI|nr:hypothetical protein MPSI1_001332 [Malassezia psittaci]
MPVELITVDDAFAWTHSSLGDTMSSKEGWTYAALKDSQCEVVYAERDGVVNGSGERAANEHPNRAKNSEMRFRMQVQPNMTNVFGTMHGGCLATVIDSLSSFVIFLHSSGQQGQPWLTLGVSQTLTVNYLAPTRVGTWIELVVKSMSIGKSVALLDTEVYELEGGKDSKRKIRTASSTHTKVDVSMRMPKL